MPVQESFKKYMARRNHIGNVRFVRERGEMEVAVSGCTELGSISSG
jgi:hypothetical protein